MNRKQGMKILITGCKGMLGRELMSDLGKSDHSVQGYDIEELDITIRDDVLGVFRSFRPDLVINCAAYTAVDKAESEPDLAFSVNCNGSENLAVACKEFNSHLIHFSTDYVFDGRARAPYREEDSVCPIGVYGKSKWAGEEAIRKRLLKHMILRISWLYGKHGKNFVKTILHLSRERDRLTVVSDQYGCPTWTGDIARALRIIIRQAEKGQDNFPWGTYHFCGQGKTTWYEFARAILHEGRERDNLKACEIKAIRTEDYPTIAKRPMWSVLDCRKIKEAFGVSPQPWRECLTEMMNGLYGEK
jgi:dTDP-4-dehydrorhamnose reductase